MKKLLIILLIMTLIITGCGSMVKNESNTKVAEYKRISAQEAKAVIDSEDVIILDVRTKEEHITGHIENSVLLPVTDIAKKAEELLVDKNAKILVYCRSGNRSAQAAKQLISMGYTNVYDFGGITDWSYEIIK